MDLHAEQDQLKKRRHELASSKRDHELKLVAIKNLIRSSGLMPAEKYKQCCDAQKKHREAIEHIEGLLGPINVRIHDIAEIQFQERSADKKRIEELERENAALREKFMFAESEIILLREERDELRADKERV